MAAAGKLGPGYRNTGLTFVRVTVREKEREKMREVRNDIQLSSCTTSGTRVIIVKYNYFH